MKRVVRSWFWSIFWPVISLILVGFLFFPAYVPPLLDRGHRSFGIPNEAARLAVLAAIKQTTGLEERFTFDAGPTHQTLLTDGFTVLNRLDPVNPWDRFSANAVSFPVSDPSAAARIATGILRSHGYVAEVQEITGPGFPHNNLIAIKSNAFTDWTLVYRRHILKMPKPEFHRVTP